jgi:hypothetical protein
MVVTDDGDHQFQVMMITGSRSVLISAKARPLTLGRELFCGQGLAAGRAGQVVHSLVRPAPRAFLRFNHDSRSRRCRDCQGEWRLRGKPEGFGLTGASTAALLIGQRCGLPMDGEV